MATVLGLIGFVVVVLVLVIGRALLAKGIDSGVEALFRIGRKPDKGQANDFSKDPR